MCTMISKLKIMAYIQISGQDIIDYIFLNDDSRTFVSYEEIDTFLNAFTKSILSNRFKPRYAGVYYKPLRELSEQLYDGILVRKENGIHLFGSIKEDARKIIELKYDDDSLKCALRDGLKAICPEMNGYTIRSINYDDIYDLYFIVAEDAFGGIMLWWQKNTPAYEVGDTFEIKYD